MEEIEATFNQVYLYFYFLIFLCVSLIGLPVVSNSVVDTVNGFKIKLCIFLFNIEYMYTNGKNISHKMH